MKNEEILKQATMKAAANGFVMKLDDEEIEWSTDVTEAVANEPIPVRGIIFSHDFAKAFWGKGEHIFDGNGWCDCGSRHTEGTSYHWQYHLQQMVLEEEPLRYLEKFL